MVEDTANISKIPKVRGTLNSSTWQTCWFLAFLNPKL